MSGTFEQTDPEIRSVFKRLNLSMRLHFEPLIKIPWGVVQREIESTAASLKRKNQNLIADTISGQLLSNTTFVLATYRVLTPIVQEGESILAHLQEAMGSLVNENIEGYIFSRFGITQEQPEKAFERACENFKKWGEEQMGHSFIYEQEISEKSLCVVNIRKCFFNDFFRKNGSSEITPAYCAADNIWMKELNKPKYLMRVERTKTLATGKDVCDFRFSKIRKS